MKTTTPGIIIVALCLIAGSIYAMPPAQAAEEAVEQVPDSKKKKAGEECKASGECQRHHTCDNTGAKSVCVAAPRPKIPPPT